MNLLSKLCGAFVIGLSLAASAPMPVTAPAKAQRLSSPKVAEFDSFKLALRQLPTNRVVHPLVTNVALLWNNPETRFRVEFDAETKYALLAPWALLVRTTNCFVSNIVVRSNQFFRVGAHRL